MTSFNYVLLSLGPVLLSLDLSLGPGLLNLGPVSLNIRRSLDLPHASLLVPARIPVSVIIRSKTAKSDLVENTALRSDEERAPGAACCGARGGI